MCSNTGFVHGVNSATTVASKEVKVDGGLGRVSMGPFLPIFSGNYKVHVRDVGVKSGIPSDTFRRDDLPDGQQDFQPSSEPDKKQD